MLEDPTAVLCLQLRSSVTDVQRMYSYCCVQVIFGVATQQAQESSR